MTWTSISGEAAFEEGIQTGLSGVLRGSLLHLQRGFPAADLEGGDVVIEPGLLVHQTPADIRFCDAGQAGERLSDQVAGLRPGRAETGAFGKAERVSQWRADRLVDRTLHAVREANPGEIAVVYVAGEEDYRGGRRPVRAFTRGDGLQQFHEVTEGILKGGPVLQVEELANELADLHRLAAPGAPADCLVPCLEVVHSGHQENRKGGAQEEVVEIS